MLTKRSGFLVKTKSMWRRAAVESQWSARFSWTRKKESEKKETITSCVSYTRIGRVKSVVFKNNPTVHISLDEYFKKLNKFNELFDHEFTISRANNFHCYEYKISLKTFDTKSQMKNYFHLLVDSHVHNIQPQVVLTNSMMHFAIPLISSLML